MRREDHHPKGHTSAPHLTSAELLARVENGDRAAAEEIFSRYMDRLTRLARTRLSPKLASRTDPEDVVMSAWRSFFLAAAGGRFSLKRSGDLWRLLVSITMHKLYRQVRRHRAARRAVDSEQALDLTDSAWLAAANSEPSPDEALALAEELEQVLSGLDEFGRRVLELRLQGETHAQIAADTNRSERSVRRQLGQIRERLLARWETKSDDNTR